MPGTYFNPLHRIFLNLSGGTVTGNTIFTQGVNISSLSASTIFSGNTNLYRIFSTSDIYITGGTFSAGTITFRNNTGGTFTVTGLTSSSTTGDTYWTSGSSGNYSLKAKNDSGLDATGDYAVAEGNNTTASGTHSHAEGSGTLASGNFGSHAEGYQTTAIANSAHAEGTSTEAIADASHAEGNQTQAGGVSSHAEGSQSSASGIAAHSEGQNTSAQGDGSHSEGITTTAIGSYSHAGGDSSIASGATSFVHSTNSFARGDRSAILGGSGITGTTDDTVYIPFLNIQSASTNNALTNFLVKESSGEIKLRNFNSILSGITSGITSVNPTYVQFGLNTYTGGTANNPTVNISAATLNYLSATTFSAGTINSGSTNLYSIFAGINTDTNDITRVQPGSNVSTGGTGNNPIVSVVSSPSLDGLTLSGTGSANIFSATTFYESGFWVLAEQDILNGGSY